MRLPLYSLIGLVVMTLSEVLMLRQVEPFWSWHTPIVWTGYLLFVDGLIYVRRGSSWLTSAWREFLFLALLSVPLWLVFEYYNRFLQNWHYINLPTSPFWRGFGYAWSFATIWPAIFESAELVSTFRQSAASTRARQPAMGASAANAWRPISKLGWASMLLGVGMLVWPIAWPSPYLAAPVWLGFIFLLDPLNASYGGESIEADWAARRYDRAVNLALGGFLCGLLWEWWNYWARTKWIYTVPILPQFKIFEMPAPGYLGFPAFALECFTMYIAVRRWFWRGPVRPVGL